MRKLAILAALLVFALPSATKANSETALALQATSPALKCAKPNIKLVGTSVVATGGCTIGNKPAPAKWGWVQKAADLSGLPCQFGTGKGTGKRSNLLAYPAGLPRISGPAIPGLVDATFTVTARWGKKTAKAIRSFHKRTPNSHVLCGAPPKLVSLDGPEPSALVWATPPTFDGAILRAGTIQSRGNGLCRWQKLPPRRQYQYLVYGNEFVCANGYSGHPILRVSYSLEGPPLCSAGFQAVSGFAVPASWGRGGVRLTYFIATWDGTGQQLAYTDDGEWTSGWRTFYGSVNPCTTDLR